VFKAGSCKSSLQKLSICSLTIAKSHGIVLQNVNNRAMGILAGETTLVDFEKEVGGLE